MPTKTFLVDFDAISDRPDPPPDPAGGAKPLDSRQVNVLSCVVAETEVDAIARATEDAAQDGYRMNRLNSVGTVEPESLEPEGAKRLRMLYDEAQRNGIMSWIRIPH